MEEKRYREGKVVKRSTQLEKIRIVVKIMYLYALNNDILIEKWQLYITYFQQYQFLNQQI